MMQQSPFGFLRDRELSPDKGGVAAVATGSWLLIE